MTFNIETATNFVNENINLLTPIKREDWKFYLINGNPCAGLWSQPMPFIMTKFILKKMGKLTTWKCDSKTLIVGK